jgi:sec-independent protein translocase protein TatA
MEFLTIVAAFGTPEMIWLFGAIVILFGAKKIPELAKGIGKGIREFNEAKDGIKTDIETSMKEKEKIQPPSSANTAANN